MWSKEKAQHQREYFSQQRRNPTGNFTEFVVRTYYCIDKACRAHKSNCCFADEVNNNKIKNIIYEGYYHNQPDHDFNAVIDDCKRNLMEMGYIHLEHRENREIIFLNKPLDFLAPGEHESYLQKFRIQKETENTGGVDVTFQPVTDQNTLTALLNHMINPDRCRDPFDQTPPEGTPKKVLTDIPCDRCGGHYILRNGRYGLFFGCSNFPKCKNSKTVADVTYSLFAKNGIDLYEVEMPCWKCGKSIKLHSYFPQLDLIKTQPALAEALDLSVIRLSIVDSWDQYLTKKYKEIYLKASKKAGFSYVANNCPHCHSLQGSQMTLSKVYDFLLTALENHTLPDYVVETLDINEATLPKEEWREVIEAIMENQHHF